jgi:three-Cys-motif partner protein
MEELPPPPAPDGLLERETGPWVEDKLRILWCYLLAFVVATRKAGRRHYIDGMAGPGVNRTEAGRFVGSPLLALEVDDPPFDRCLLMDQGEKEIRALEHRTASYGGRAVVRRGDTNRDLVPLMQAELERFRPAICVLDPEGADLHWDTVRGVADFRREERTKVEQLILFPTDTGFMRLLPLQHDPDPIVAGRITAMYGNTRWDDIYRRRQREELTPDEARTEYVRLYGAGLRELGYETVLDREVRRRGRHGHLLYILMFATDHEAGERIMDHCFEKVFAEEAQPQLPGFEPPPRRRRL